MSPGQRRYPPPRRLRAPRRSPDRPNGSGTGQAEPPAEQQDSARREALLQANEVISSAAKWLIASLGAIGAVLVAGSQLSSIGNLPIGPRFLAAIVGLGIGLSGVLLAIWQVVGVLAPNRYTISRIAEEWDASGATKTVYDPDGNVTEHGGVHGGRWKQRKYPVPDWLGRNPEHLAGKSSPRELLAMYFYPPPQGRAGTITAINNMSAAANLVQRQARWRALRWPLVAATIAAGVGVCVFAWAANPGEGAATSLRNADLSGADMSGVSLEGADLTGADLTNADLRGANLNDAVVDDVTWSDTTCPDGTNSDDTAAADGTGGSCEGHLSP